MARIASQESYVQNSNPNPSLTHPTFSASLDQAFARAVARLTADLEPPPTDPAPPVNEAPTDIPTVEQLVHGAELFRILREPIDWLLSLAHRLAIDDPVDLAAVQRVRAVMLARLMGQPVGLRARDVLIVFGLLVSALDPLVVIRALSSTLSQGLAAVLESEPVSFFAAAIQDPIARRQSQLGCASYPCCPLHAHRSR
jgi:hypothetical protein